MNIVRRQWSCIVRQNFGSKVWNFSSYSSSISLKRLYPESELNLTSPKFSDAEKKGFSGFIPLDQLQITYSRSSGPGGQNVNVVNTKVDLRFHVESATWISDDIKSKFLSQQKTKISKDGFFIIRSDRTRSQQLNLADALDRLRNLIWKYSAPEPTPSAESVERIRQLKEKAVRIRLAEKKRRSQTKSERQSSIVEL